MRYQTFGRQSGLRISEYVLGTSNFGSAPAAAGLAGAKAIFEDFVAAGGTTFDVSNIAQNGEAETVLGELLGRDRDEFVVITKYTATSQPDRRPTATGNSRKSMIRSLEESLRRLKTDYVDVFMPPYLSGMSALPFRDVRGPRGSADAGRAGMAFMPAAGDGSECCAARSTTWF